MTLQLVEDRVAVHAAGKPMRVRVARWVGDAGVQVHKYTFYSAPNTLMLRALHRLLAGCGAQIVIFEYGDRT